MKRIKGSSETSIYIIDSEYHIVHFNRALARIFPELQCGDICYDILCGEDAPCKGCPLNVKDKEGAIFYNKLVKKWVEVNTGLIDWPGVGSCNVILCKDIYEGNKNLFYNLADISVYDELFELNLTNNTYKILYHLEGKYIIPAMEGNLAEMLMEVTQKEMIHPEDQEAFWEFWNLQALEKQFEYGRPREDLWGEFRKKMTNGEYCWVVQRVVPLKEDDKGEKVVLCFIQDIHTQKVIELEKIQGEKVQNNTTDVLTGLLKRRPFYKAVQEFLKGATETAYCLMAIDIEHFKLFNAWYGQEAGDRCLKHIAALLKKTQQEYQGIAGYMGDDDFAILLPDEELVIRELQDPIIDYVKQYGGNAGFLPVFGLYAIEYPLISVSNMYDRASIAMASVKGNYAVRSCRYDADMMRNMEKDHVLLLEIQRALEQGEFVFYAQPKCNMATGKIIGLESLVRWEHPERGLVLPGEFIPLLEEKGLITELDRYIWEKVCRSLRDWIDCGHHPIPISVNVSRIDIYTIDIVRCFKQLVEKYQLDAGLLEIEITESAYVEEYQIITSAVEELRSAGFTVLMDDFGSGYSSLNMLKDVNVDVLKIDMKFLEISANNAGKEFGILEAVISMARLMGLRMIAEGIETKEQMDLLLDMGCYYGQGYYFYHPMPVEVLESLIGNENNVDFRGIKARHLERVRIKELLNENMFSETVINNILGGIAFYEVSGEEICLVSVNEQYYKVTGTNPMDLEERKMDVAKDIYEEDYQKAFHIFEESKRNFLNGAEGDVRRIRDDGKMMWLHIKTFYLGEKDGTTMYYGAVSDVTEGKEREQKLEASQKALSAAVNVSVKDPSFMNLTEENRRAAASIFAQMTPGGMIGGYCEEGFPIYFANYEIVKLMGYNCYEEMKEAIDGKVINTIHPEDRNHVSKDIGSEYYPGMEYTTTYRMLKKDGSWFWTLDKGKVVETEDGRLAIVSACTDITESIMVQQSLYEKNQKLQHQTKYLEFQGNAYLQGVVRDVSETVKLQNKMQLLKENSPENIFVITYSKEMWNYEVISDGLFKKFGYSKEEYEEQITPECLYQIVCEDRWKVIEEKIIVAIKKRDNYEETVKVKFQHDNICWIRIEVRYIKESSDGVIYLCICTDITPMKQKEDELIMAGKKMESILRQAGINSWDWDMKQHTMKIQNVVRNRDLEELYTVMKKKEVILENYPECVIENKTGKFHQNQLKKLLHKFCNGKNGEQCSVDVPLQVSMDRMIWLRIVAETIYDEAGQPARAVGYYIDVTKEKNEEITRRENMKSLEILRKQALFDFKVNLSQNTVSFDKRGEEWARETGCQMDWFFTENIEYIAKKRILSDFKDAYKEFLNRDRLIQLYHHGKRVDSLDYKRIYCGEERWIRSIVHLVKFDDTKDIYAYLFVMDIDQQKNQELRLTKMAETDALTGLYNRHSAVKRVEKYLEETKHHQAVLMMFDLDNFKVANDVFGHTYGDYMIAQNAEKLRKFFRQGDVLCRVGGDEFMVLCKEMENADAERKLGRIIKEMEIKYNDGEQEIIFSISAGYAMIPEDGTTFQELYEKADIALFAAKMDGKSAYRKYESSMKAVRYELAD